MVLLQDWESKTWLDDQDDLRGVLFLGYDPSKPTNQNLCRRLTKMGLDHGMTSAYITNVHPIMKDKPDSYIRGAARMLFEKYTLLEVHAVRPKLIICAGSVPAAVMMPYTSQVQSLSSLIYKSIEHQTNALVACVPHPSGRGVSKETIDKKWKEVNRIWKMINTAK